MIGFAIRKPVTVLVGAILVVLFGLIAAFRLPVQLTPDVDRPIITVQTFWEGASPKEVEREIVREQEEKLKSVSGLRKMNSTAVKGSATIELEFRVGIDVDRALLDVSDRLRQVPSYPSDVDEPVVRAGETRGANAIAWFILERSEGSALAEGELPLLRTMIQEDIQPRLERAEGVASIGIFGGVESEIHIRVDPYKLASRKLTMIDVRDAIRRRNVDVSAGTLDRGKRSWSVRTVGRFESLEEIEDLVLARRSGQPVYLREVATVERGFKEAQTIVRARGSAAIAVNATRQSGTNVIEVMESLKAAVVAVNRDELRRRGVKLTQVYDQTEYIYSAMHLVLQNLWVGGLLAITVLLLFLRSGSSTLIVAIAIPVSVIGAFLGLTLLGRNLNVISMAGLAFAVGMVVDNSIVVLENIYRHRQEGEDPFTAALEGTKEVWGAVVASTLTTLAVFVPVIFIEEEAGQLFRDIAIAISAAVLLSLVISVLFIPMAAARLVRGTRKPVEVQEGSSAASLASGIAGFVAWLNQSVMRRLLTVVGLTGAAVGLSWLILPPMAYLPSGNQNLVIGFVIPPPGYNLDEFEEIAKQVEARLEPYWGVREGKELGPEERWPPWFQGEGELPGLENFFYVASGNNVFMGARSMDATNVKPLAQLMMHAVAEIPGLMVFAFQTSLFQRGISAGNAIDLEVSGFDMRQIKRSALALMGRIMQSYGFPRPEPANFHLAAPELRVRLDESRASELGLSARDVGFLVQSLIDGAIVSDYREGGVTLDVKLLPGERADSSDEQIRQVPVYTPSGRQVPLSLVAAFEPTTASNEIRHIEEKRAVRLIVTPPEGVELSVVMEDLGRNIIPALREGGAIPPGVTTTLAGTAAKLTSTREALELNFVLAIVITYLLLSALFESFFFPVVILFSVPLAAAGGILGLRIVHSVTGQQMDVLTMLGFVILIGTVVNNAILIVHQAINLIREGSLGDAEAIVESVRTRVRPIFMSTSTSVLGMTPLVLFPGAGSELYKGLGSVVIGGLVASTLFTLLVVPTLFSMTLRVWRLLQRGASPS